MLLYLLVVTWSVTQLYPVGLLAMLHIPYSQVRSIWACAAQATRLFSPVHNCIPVMGNAICAIAQISSHGVAALKA